MATSEESCDGNPNFAIICSFVTKFGEDCGIQVSIPDLQQMLEDTKNAVSEELKEIHIHLLRKGKKRVNKEKWERSLIKFCHEYSSVDAWELERFGYKKAKLSVKLEILKRLLELQFDSNAKFKADVNKSDAVSLRVLPIGRDISGNMYWYQLDHDCNMRLYRQDVADESSWQLLCTTKESLRELLSLLGKQSVKGDISEFTKHESTPDSVEKVPLDPDPTKSIKLESDEKPAEDMTASLSLTKPCAIIIKTEKKEFGLNPDRTLTEGSEKQSALPEQSAALPVAVPAEVTKSPSDKSVHRILVEETHDKTSGTPCSLNTDCTSAVVVSATEVMDSDANPSSTKDVNEPLDRNRVSEVKSVPSEQELSTNETANVVSVTISEKGTVEMPPNAPPEVSNSETSGKSVRSLDIVEKPSDFSECRSNSTSASGSDVASEKVNLPTATDNSSSKLDNPCVSSDADLPEVKYRGSKIMQYQKWSSEKKKQAVVNKVSEASDLSFRSSMPTPEFVPQVESCSQRLNVCHPLSSANEAFKSVIAGSVGPFNCPEVPMDLSRSNVVAPVLDQNWPSAVTSIDHALKNSLSTSTDKDYKTVESRPESKKESVAKTNASKILHSTDSILAKPFKKKHHLIPEEDICEQSRHSVIFEVKNSQLIPNKDSAPCAFPVSPNGRSVCNNLSNIVGTGCISEKSSESKLSHSHPEMSSLSVNRLISHSIYHPQMVSDSKSSFSNHGLPHAKSPVESQWSVENTAHASERQPLYPEQKCKLSDTSCDKLTPRDSIISDTTPERSDAASCDPAPSVPMFSPLKDDSRCKKNGDRTLTNDIAPAVNENRENCVKTFPDDKVSCIVALEDTSSLLPEHKAKMLGCSTDMQPKSTTLLKKDTLKCDEKLDSGSASTCVTATERSTFQHQEHESSKPSLKTDASISDSYSIVCKTDEAGLKVEKLQTDTTVEPSIQHTELNSLGKALETDSQSSSKCADGDRSVFEHTEGKFSPPSSDSKDPDKSVLTGDSISDVTAESKADKDGQNVEVKALEAPSYSDQKCNLTSVCEGFEKLSPDVECGQENGKPLSCDSKVVAKAEPISSIQPESCSNEPLLSETPQPKIQLEIENRQKSHSSSKDRHIDSMSENSNTPDMNELKTNTDVTDKVSCPSVSAKSVSNKVDKEVLDDSLTGPQECHSKVSTSSDDHVEKDTLGKGSSSSESPVEMPEENCQAAVKESDDCDKLTSTESKETVGSVEGMKGKELLKQVTCFNTGEETGKNYSSTNSETATGCEIKSPSLDCPVTVSFKNNDTETTAVQNTDIKENTLQNTDIKENTLQNTDIKQSTLQNTDIEESTLQNTDIKESTLQNTDIKQNTLQNTDIEESTLQNTDIKESIYEYPQCDNDSNGTKSSDCKSADSIGITRSHANNTSESSPNAQHVKNLPPQENCTEAEPAQAKPVPSVADPEESKTLLFESDVQKGDSIVEKEMVPNSRSVDCKEFDELEEQSCKVSDKRTMPIHDQAESEQLDTLENQMPVIEKEQDVPLGEDGNRHSKSGLEQKLSVVTKDAKEICESETGEIEQTSQCKDISDGEKIRKEKSVPVELSMRTKKQEGLKEKPAVLGMKDSKIQLSEVLQDVSKETDKSSELLTKQESVVEESDNQESLPKEQRSCSSIGDACANEPSKVAKDHNREEMALLSSDKDTSSKANNINEKSETAEVKDTTQFSEASVTIPVEHKNQELKEHCEKPVSAVKCVTEDVQSLKSEVQETIACAENPEQCVVSHSESNLKTDERITTSVSLTTVQTPELTEKDSLVSVPDTSSSKKCASFFHKEDNSDPMAESERSEPDVIKQPTTITQCDSEEPDFNTFKNSAEIEVKTRDSKKRDKSENESTIKCEQVENVVVSKKASKGKDDQLTPERTPKRNKRSRRLSAAVKKSAKVEKMQIADPDDNAVCKTQNTLQVESSISHMVNKLENHKSDGNTSKANETELTNELELKLDVSCAKSPKSKDPKAQHQKCTRATRKSANRDVELEPEVQIVDLTGKDVKFPNSEKLDEIKEKAPRVGGGRKRTASARSRKQSVVSSTLQQSIAVADESKTVEESKHKSEENSSTKNVPSIENDTKVLDLEKCVDNSSDVDKEEDAEGRKITNALKFDFFDEEETHASFELAEVCDLAANDELVKKLRHFYTAYVPSVCQETKYKHEMQCSGCNNYSFKMKHYRRLGLSSSEFLTTDIDKKYIAARAKIAAVKELLAIKGPQDDNEAPKVEPVTSRRGRWGRGRGRRGSRTASRARNQNSDASSQRGKAQRTRSGRGRSAVQKTVADFTLPEGFLEILDNSSETIKSNDEPKSKPSVRGRRGRAPRLSLPSSESESLQSAPRKRSRRIQEQHQKKMSELAVEMQKEHRRLEQLAKKNTAPAKKPGPRPKEKPKPVPKSIFDIPDTDDTCLEAKHDGRRKRRTRAVNMAKLALMYDDESKDSEHSTSRSTEKSRRRRGTRGRRRGYKPWDLSSESSSTVEELTEEEEEEEPEEQLVFNANEDEFACEEVDEDAEPVIPRRARTAKKVVEGENDVECIVDDKPCGKCGKFDRPEWILLCDKCNDGYHTSCLLPALEIIPDGDWYCQPCEHLLLYQVLSQELHKLEQLLKQKEREELRKQRLAYVGISLDNVLKPEKKESESGSDEASAEEPDEDRALVKRSSDDEIRKKVYGKRSSRARRNVNYQFKEYDELIASAIGDELLEFKMEDEFAAEAEVEEKVSEDDDSYVAPPPFKRKKMRKLNDLDYTDEEDSGDDYKGLSTDTEHTPSENTEISQSGSEAASGEWRIVKTKPKAKRRGRARRGKYSSCSDDLESDGSSYRPTTRRAAQKQISYRELSSEDEWGDVPQKVTKRKKKDTSSDSTSEASYKVSKSKGQKRSKVKRWKGSSSSESEEASDNESSGSEGSESTRQSAGEWKIEKKSTEGGRIKININKKVLESDSESSSKKQKPKKRFNKVISDSSDNDEDDDDEDDDDDENEDSSSSEMTENSNSQHSQKHLQQKSLDVSKKSKPSAPDSKGKCEEKKQLKPAGSQEKISSNAPVKDADSKPKAVSSVTDSKPNLKPKTVAKPTKPVESLLKPVTSTPKPVATQEKAPAAAVTPVRVSTLPSNVAAVCRAVAMNRDHVTSSQIVVKTVVVKTVPKGAIKEIKMVPSKIQYKDKIDGNEAETKKPASSTKDQPKPESPSIASNAKVAVPVKPLVNKNPTPNIQVPPKCGPQKDPALIAAHTIPPRPFMNSPLHQAGSPLRQPMMVNKGSPVPQTFPTNVMRQHSVSPLPQPHSFRGAHPQQRFMNSAMDSSIRPIQQPPQTAMPVRSNMPQPMYSGAPMEPRGIMPLKTMVPRPTSIPPSSYSSPPLEPLNHNPMQQQVPQMTAVKNVTQPQPYSGSIVEPFSSADLDQGSDSRDEIPLERIPCDTDNAPSPYMNKNTPYEKDNEYRPAKEAASYPYNLPEEKGFSTSYSPLSSLQEFTSRPSPLKPSLVESYPSSSSPTRLTPLDSYPQSSSPKGFISLDSYPQSRKRGSYGNMGEGEPRPMPSSDSYQSESRFPQEPYPCPSSPGVQNRDAGTPPRLYSQFPDTYAPPRSPEFYQGQQYFPPEEGMPRASFQGSYNPPDQVPQYSYMPNAMQHPNDGFMIDTILRARNEEDELGNVSGIVQYITQQ